MDEESVAVGDVYRIGTAVLQVSQARQPCWKLNWKFGIEALAKRFQETGRTGWYYRVLKPGEIAKGDDIESLAKPHPEWPISRLLHLLYVDKLNSDALEEMSRLEPLSESWRELAQIRLKNRTVESFRSRLNTPS